MQQRSRLISFFTDKNSSKFRQMVFRILDKCGLSSPQRGLTGSPQPTNESHSQPLIMDKKFILHNVELTNQCPMRCMMCPRTNHMTRPQGIMDYGLFTKIMDEYWQLNPSNASDIGIWLHHFGESLTHPEFARFISYASDKGIAAKLSLNPIMLTPDISNLLLNARPFLLYLCLDGHDDDSFEKIRGMKNGYQKSYDNIMRFLELKRQIGSSTKLIISMIDFDLNAPSIAIMREFWESQEGVDEFLLKPFESWDGSAKEISRLKNDAELVTTQHKRHVVCVRPWNSLTITWNGDVVPCCFDYDAKYVLGNANDETLLDIWNGPRMQTLRHEFLSGTLLNQLCCMCESAYEQEA